MSADDFYRNLTQHVEKRLRQRGISREGVLAALAYGHIIYGRAVTRYYLRRCDVPPDQAADLARFAGLVVVVGEGGKIVTAYRQPSGTRVKRAAAWR